MMDFERAETLYDLIADKLAPVLREWNRDALSTPNDLVMHLTPSEVFEALHAARLLNIGPEHDHLRRDCNAMQPGRGACPDEWQPYHDAGSHPEHCRTCSEVSGPDAGSQSGGVDRG